MPPDLPSVAPEERLYAVGDIHGRDDLLCALLPKLIGDAERLDDGRKTRIVFLGDYIDRGDNSRDVIETLAKADSDHPGVFEFLAGNHEAALLAFLEDPARGADWLDWGGRQTLASYGVAIASRRPDTRELVTIRNELYHRIKSHLPFFEALKRHTVSGDVVFAHAGLDPARALEEQTDDVLLWGQITPGQDVTLPGKRLVHGHFAEYEPVSDANRVCVDTGAYFSGRLTAVRLDAGEAYLSADVTDVLQ